MVTERNTSLKSGSIDSVQNPEAELRDFEARKREAEIFAFGKLRLCLVGLRLHFSAKKRQRRTRVLVRDSVSSSA